MTPQHRPVGGGGAEAHVAIHWEAASAFYLFLLTALGALFCCALLTHPPSPSSRRARKGEAAAAAVSSASRSSRNGAAVGGERRAPAESSGRPSGAPPEECIKRPDDGADSTLSPADDGASRLRAAAFPDATLAERLRFLNARDGDIEAASEMLSTYLEWRKEHVGYETEADRRETARRRRTDSEFHWARACEVASKALGEAPTSPLPSVLYWAEDDKGRPRQSLDGRRILQHLPARIDTGIASGRYYALALALFLDRTLDRTSDEKFCVTIDTRPGTGWGNVPAPKLVSFIKHAAALLNGLHPERLAQCVLFPVPFWAKGMWNVIRPFLDADTASKICLVSGSDKVESEPPAKLVKYFDKGVVDLMERKRLGCFEVNEGDGQ